MFFKQIRYNAAKNRKENGLFFATLVVTIITFYTLLSFDSQDIMRFLKSLEGDAVNKLMQLVPIVYALSLFFLFFLVYFAYRYQLEKRKKELGLYLMLGMKRSTLFAMLMVETLWNSLASVFLGLPCALLLTEGISLTTAKLIGLGIIGHKISFSLPALLGTVIGFMAVQMIAMLFLSIAYSRKELLDLLHPDVSVKQSPLSNKMSWISFAFGGFFLILAYMTGVKFLRTFNLIMVSLILFLGILGTFLLFRGLGGLIGYYIRRKGRTKSGLFTFTARQIQENVLYQHKALAISSLLLLTALSCISFGIGVSAERGSLETRTVDFSITGSEEEIHQALEQDTNQSKIASIYPMYINSIIKPSHNLSSPEYGLDCHDFSWSGLISALEKQPQTDLRDNILNYLSHTQDLYLISESSYNALLQSLGKPPLQLGKNQAALYTSMNDSSGEFGSTLNSALASGSFVEIEGEQFELLPTLCDDNVVADRKISLYTALIVSDEKYQEWISENNRLLCWNVLLNQKFVEEKGLLQAIQEIEQHLMGTNLEYESFLSGIGRNLFYPVAGSYLGIYLGIMFIIIANTVIGLKYLIQQRANQRRYHTLLMLGADIKELCQSARSQIKLYFGLALGLAVLSSVFAIWSMFTSFLKLPPGTPITKVVIIAGITVLLFIMIEYIYIRMVERTSHREIIALQTTDRSSVL